jgi:hypothetical protein
MKSLLRGIITALLVSQTLSHSWIEQINVIDAHGNYTGQPGYPRGYVDRANPGFSDSMMTYLLPPNSVGRTRVNPSDLLCKPTQRTPNNNTQNFPSLVARPGDHVAMKYLENGHVTLPQNQLGKPGSGGLVYVYATTTPVENETITNVLSWTTNNTLGQGRLLTIQNFDDGRCYQINSGPISVSRQKEFPDPIPGQPGSVHEQWCETDIQVPMDVQAGPLAVYWVWQWPTMPNIDPGVPNGKDEIYTTCSDFQIVINSTIKKSDPSAVQLLVQDPQMQAHKDYTIRAANQTVPTNTMFLGPGNNNIAQSSTTSMAATSMSYLPNTSSAPQMTNSITVSSSAATTGLRTSITIETITITEYETTATPSAFTSSAHRRTFYGAKFRD